MWKEENENEKTILFESQGTINSKLSEKVPFIVYYSSSKQNFYLFIYFFQFRF